MYAGDIEDVDAVMSGTVAKAIGIPVSAVEGPHAAPLNEEPALAELDLGAARIHLDSARQGLARVQKIHEHARDGGQPGMTISLLQDTEKAFGLAELDYKRAQLKIERLIIRGPVDGAIVGDWALSQAEGFPVEAGQTLLLIRPAPATQPAKPEL